MEVIHYQRLEELAAFLDTFYQNRVRMSGARNYRHEYWISPCGTSACALGWSATLLHRETLEG